MLPECSIANRPKMLAPSLVSAALWIFLLQPPRSAAFEPLNNLTNRLGRRILNEHMNVIFADRTFENAHILSITDLDPAVLDIALITLEHVIAT